MVAVTSQENTQAAPGLLCEALFGAPFCGIGRVRPHRKGVLFFNRSMDRTTRETSVPIDFSQLAGMRLRREGAIENRESRR